MHSLIIRFRTAAFGSPFSLTSPLLLVALASLFFLPTVNGDDATAKAPPTRVLRVAYFCPSDRQPHASYEVRLLGVTRNIQTFYRNGMKANGFGPTTFPLDMKGDGSLRIIMVNGQQPTSAYDRSLRDAKTRIRNEVKEAFAAEGLDYDQEVVLVFQALLVAEPGKTTGKCSRKPIVPCQAGVFSCGKF